MHIIPDDVYAGVSEIVSSIIIAQLLGLAIGYVYARAYHGLFLSKSFVHTCVVLCPLVAMIANVIRVNARSGDVQSGQALAFLLVGLLGLIRFRTVVRDTREFTFIFISIVGGAGIGAGLVFLAFPITIGILCLLIGLEKFNFGEAIAPAVRVKISGAHDALSAYRTALESRSAAVQIVMISTAAEQGTRYVIECALKTSDLMGTIEILKIIPGTSDVSISLIQRGKGGEAERD